MAHIIISTRPAPKFSLCSLPHDAQYYVRRRILTIRKLWPKVKPNTVRWTHDDETFEKPGSEERNKNEPKTNANQWKLILVNGAARHSTHFALNFFDEMNLQQASPLYRSSVCGRKSAFNIIIDDRCSLTLLTCALFVTFKEERVFDWSTCCRHHFSFFGEIRSALLARHLGGTPLNKTWLTV